MRKKIEWHHEHVATEVNPYRDWKYKIGDVSSWTCKQISSVEIILAKSETWKLQFW